MLQHRWSCGRASAGSRPAGGAAGVPGEIGLVPAMVPVAGGRRPIRVVLLSAAIVLMSLGDLHITMTYLRSVGMGEGNPVARLVMTHGSESLLVVWKCASVAFACLIFYKFRAHRCAEIACWLSFLVLTWLLMRWTNYAEEAWRLTPALHVMHESDVAQWVRIAE